jgi:DNA-directed RNA polymerase subunit omega
MSDQGSPLLQNKYSLVKGAARRARQLQSGAPPLGVSHSMKACRVAQDEIRVGKVTFRVMGKEETPPPEPEPEPEHETE